MKEGGWRWGKRLGERQGLNMDMDDFGRTIRLPTTPHITVAARLPRIPGASGKVLRTHFHLGMSRQGQQAGHDGR